MDQLLLLNYPEFEVIVVNNGARESLDALRERFALNACEVFFRRSLPTPPVRAIFRSTSIRGCSSSTAQGIRAATR